MAPGHDFAVLRAEAWHSRRTHDGVRQFPSRWNAKIPKLFFTHDNYINDYLGTEHKLDIYGRSRVVLLVRDPRDTAVSWYFQWKYRMLRRKKVINRAPLEDPGIYNFIAGEDSRRSQIIRFLNAWAKDLDGFPS